MGKRKSKRLISLITIFLLFSSFFFLLYKTHFIKLPLPKIAIIIDDFGYNIGPNVEKILSLPYPLTLAILPNAPYSRRISLLAKEKEKEVILHLPMEPKELPQKSLEEETILCKMSTLEIEQIVEKGLEKLRYVKGVSNHMGSKATENRRVMEVVLSVIKRKRLYFVDSKTTDSSIVKEVAEKLGVRFSKRDVFLDVKDDPQYINHQFDILIKKAKSNGEAIGLAHIHSKFLLSVLKKRLPYLGKERVRLVFASEIVD